MMGGVYSMSYFERLLKQSRVWVQFRFGVRVAEGGTHVYGAKYPVAALKKESEFKRWDRHRAFEKKVSAEIEEVYESLVGGKWVKVTRYTPTASGIPPTPRKRRRNRSGTKGKYRRT